MYMIAPSVEKRESIRGGWFICGVCGDNVLVNGSEFDKALRLERNDPTQLRCDSCDRAAGVRAERRIITNTRGFPRIVSELITPEPLREE